MKTKRVRGLLALMGTLATLGFGDALAHRVDVLVLYTDEAKLKDPAATVANMINYGNQSLRNSRVDIELRLVKLEKINFRGDSLVDSAALDALRANREVAGLREKHGADLVALITAGPDRCGKAWLAEGDPKTGLFDASTASYAFSATAADCNTAFVHELGHNMGLDHGLGTDGSSGGVYAWGRGYGVRNSFATIMAYASSFGRAVEVPYFSNPRLRECDGQDCGIDHQQRDGADSAQALNLLGPQLAAFRAEVAPGGGAGAGDLEAPSVPTELRADGIAETSLSFSWRASNDNTGVSAYEVRRNGNLVATVAETRYSDQGLTPDTAYSYTVAAKDAAGNASAVSVPLNTRTLAVRPPPDTQAPSIPGGLQANAVEQTSVALAWLASVDNLGVTGYQVLRDGVKVGTTDRVDYRDAGLQPGTRYRYAVRAADAAGNLSALSEAAVVTTKPQDATGNPTTGNLLLNGDFGKGISGWKAQDSRIGIKTDASGNPSLLVRNRTDWDAGVGHSVRGLIKAGKTYQVSADFRIADPGIDDDLGAIYLYVEEKGYRGEWIPVAYDWVTGTWSKLSGTFTFDPTGEVRKAELVVFGPEAGVKFALDNVVLEEVAD